MRPKSPDNVKKYSSKKDIGVGLIGQIGPMAMLKNRLVFVNFYKYDQLDFRSVENLINLGSTAFLFKSFSSILSRPD